MKRKYLYFSLFSLLLSACGDDSMKVDGPDFGLQGEIRLQADIDQVNLTRADDGGFADGDRIGVFAVSYDKSMNPGTLMSSGNLADNVGFTFNELSFSWEGDRQLYFPDERTPVDFYGCYPYDASLEEVSAYRFSVQGNQETNNVTNGMGGYEASDFLWAKSAAVTPSTPIVNLTFKHILAAVQVTLIEGDSFGDGEWLQLNKDVMVTNTNRNAEIDLSSGIVKTIGDKDDRDIKMNPHNGDYRAIVVPQSVDAGQTVVSISVGGHSYSLVKGEDMHYQPSKLHKFTIQVDKASENGDFQFTLVDESVTAWESDSESHNGKVKEYIVVDVPTGGGLQKAIEATGLLSEEIINIKITGELNDDDFYFMRKNMKYLEALNLKDALLADLTIPDGGCAWMLFLKYVVFPEKLRKIGGDAFRHTNLTGSLTLPEGLEYIGAGAFCNWEAGSDARTNLSGTLTLPSTLKYIGGGAFRDCDFTGSLVLPEGLEVIENEAFQDCKAFTGELHLPHSLKTLQCNAFANTGFHGHFDIPRSLTEIENFFFPDMMSFSWPESPVTIKDEAFWRTNVRGDILIPQTVTHIGRAAFAETGISHLVFPENLEFIEEEVLANCRNLMDTIVIPPLIETIGYNAFAGCEKLDAVVLPKSLHKINGGAFGGCFSMTYIHCQALTPPEVDESAFDGVDKDNFTVEVPEQSVDEYRNAPGWREFKRVSAYRDFVARPSKYNVLNKGGKREIILNADGKWEMTECPEWCHIDRTSGSMKTVIKLTVDPLTHGSPARTGTITFRLDDADHHLTHINIGQYDYEYDEDAYLQLQNATKGKGIDLFFVGDGYDAIDISNGLYLDDMKQEMEYLFAVEPYTTYREYFNVYTSFAMSEDSGVESLNRWRNTKFNTCLGDGSTRLSAEWMAAMDYCAMTCNPISGRPDPSVGVILLANTDMYEGITYAMLGSDSFCSVVTKSALEYPSDARGLIQHEAGGHGIGWLADEYVYHHAFINNCKCTCCGHVGELQANQSYGFGLNLSLNGKYRQVPWSHLIFNQAYGDMVDIYEGGYFHSRGVYRSEYNSCMNNNVPYFSSWSRQLIVQRIMKMAGENFDLDSFYAKDSRSVGRDFTSKTRSGINDGAEYAPRGHAPVMINNYKFGKKGGKR